MAGHNVWKKSFLFSLLFHILLVSFVGVIFAYSAQVILPEQVFVVALDLAPGGGGGGGGQGASKPEQATAEPLLPSRSTSFATSQLENPSPDALLETRKETAPENPAQEVQQQAFGGQQPQAAVTGGSGPGSGGGHGLGRGTGTGSGVGAGSGSGSGGGHGLGQGSGTGSGSGEGNAEARAEAIERFVREVERNKGSYPYMALKQNRQGVAYIYVELDAAGNVLSQYVAASSGDKSLDEGALKAIQRTCPFSHGLAGTLAMTVPVRWTIS